MRIRLWLLLIILFFLNSCSSVDPIEPPVPLEPINETLQIDKLWEVDAGNGNKGTLFKLVPVFANDTIFTASINGEVNAFQLSDGASVWSTDLKYALSSGPGVGNDIVVVGTSDGDVIALSEENGSELWHTHVTSEVLSPAVINNGIVVIRTVDGKLFGLDSLSGGRLWVYERTMPLLTLRGTSTPIIINNEAIVSGFDNGKLATLELKTGKLLRDDIAIAVAQGRTELERMIDIDATPLLIGSTIYVTSFQGKTVAIDLYQGKLLWERDVYSYSGLGGNFDAIYLSDLSSDIWALDSHSGTSLWKQTKLHARQITTPVSIGDYVVTSDFEGYVHWLRQEDGQFVARYAAGNRISSPALVVENTAIIYTDRGKLLALRPAL